MRALVVGAQPDSLGEAIAKELKKNFTQVVTAGVSGKEMLRLNIAASGMCSEFFMRYGSFDAVICTAGINDPGELSDLDFFTNMQDHYAVNVLGPLRLLKGWLDHNDLPPVGGLQQFVAISSNSAHIARTRSMPYCTSKAALSMAMRIAGREWSGSNRLIYAWEPGAIAGTPMTKDVLGRLPAGVPLSRSPAAPRGMDRAALARTIAVTLSYPHAGLQGATLRIDGGEQ